MKLYFTALGCRLNQAEIESLMRQAMRRGHSIVATPQEADWAIINTCTVTHIASRKSRQAIRKLHHANPALRIAVLGCYGEISPAEAKALPGVALVVPNAQKEHFLDYLGLEAPLSPKPLMTPPPGAHTRAFIRVQDGCDNACAYCIVTIARGASRSRLPEEILAEIRERLAEGAQEVVLTGVNIGAYGQDRPEHGPLPPSKGWNLARLVRYILEETPLPRLRLSSIEPWDLTEELMTLWPHPRLCRHLHLPLQSGSDVILRRMGRPITAEAFRNLVAAVRQRVPEISLSTDLIVGFPGETEADFEATYTLAQEIGFSRLHVFRFSPRPGTPAARMAEPVPAAVAQTRSERLIALGEALALAYHQRFVGQTFPVLFETHDDTVPPLWSGLTDHYIRVWAPSPENLHNRIVWVRCLEAAPTGMRGMVESHYPTAEAKPWH